ncbi:MULTISPECIES: CBS domain-containing protein [unclassified Nocardia]|uniref:CBS domain-containing protein n=1 Tax=unclassified Nocardia TaxID=2637762 RepID=UPI001CE40190|nr:MULTISPECIES: CBS domain-containing protein [unclassified Nocardia]
MTTARDLMTEGVKCVRSSDSVVDAARLMRDLNVGALPICGEDNRLKGMLTDRDIVVKVIAERKDPTGVHASELAEGTPVTVQVDDDAGQVLSTMKQHQVRRVPVLDGNELVGIVAQADVANALGNTDTGGLVEDISKKG